MAKKPKKNFKAQVSVSKQWKCLKAKVLFQHSRITIVEDYVKLPNGNVVQYLRFANGGQGVTVICLKDNKILLQKEYSYPVNKVLYQFPGGKIKDGESLTNAVVRELIEESGLKPKRLEQLGWYYPNNRRTNSKMHVVLAQDIVESEKKGGDIEEKIESQWIPISHFKKMLNRGKIVNYSVLAAWALLQSRL